MLNPASIRPDQSQTVPSNPISALLTRPVQAYGALQNEIGKTREVYQQWAQQYKESYVVKVEQVKQLTQLLEALQTAHAGASQAFDLEKKEHNQLVKALTIQITEQEKRVEAVKTMIPGLATKAECQPTVDWAARIRKPVWEWS